ncbi:dihydroxyacetone kinase subunit DhaK [Hydrogenoanaerobacterium sp.]|uniref:dihydroxyacetone kinase subunit DhaK n=1 Tax=Hydrogenoanaerobacterium sp. TaxID=2953763 RepID=UPI00289B1B3B|nr:dihydroxyacetone kinase subunit DhaK [Hydrogenoanaerobacterium sp.]
MRKIINKPENFVDETIEGILFAYGDRVKLLNEDKRVILTNYPVKKGKVGIVTAGGSGHLPVFLGYVGQGMLDGCAVGNVFASPSSQKMADMIKACDYGSGVLCLYGNYGGDNMNFDMACELVEFDDVETRTVRVKDDVASSPKEAADKRRGVAGMVYAFKLAGAAAEKMMSLDEVAQVAQKALDCTRTMGVALSPCIVPEVGKPTFSINDDEIEIGMGIHGERGIEVRKMMTADEVAQTVLEKILADMPLEKGDEVSIMVNGLGATPLEELLIVYRKLHLLLADKGVTIYMPHVGEFATSMEMAGLSITVLKLDDQLKELLRSPASTPFYTNANK